MALFISGARLTEAIQRLANWRGSVQSQKSVHLFTFLALTSRGVGHAEFAQYEEEYDLAFFLGLAEIQSGYLRSRLFLALARLQELPDAEIERGLLAIQD